MTGRVKKGRVYGLGAQYFSCRQSPYFAGASSFQTSEKMEEM